MARLQKILIALGYLMLALAVLLLPAASAWASPVTVFRSPSCGCCRLWSEHMEAAGFGIEDRVRENMGAVKQRYGLSAPLESCHTAVVEGYVIEGHVPAADVRRLLAERPDITGLAAPGMPMGSPGMEMGDRRDPYAVIAFSPEGYSIFAEHP